MRAKVNSAFGRLYKRVWNNNNLKKDTKINVYKAVVLTTVLHGAASWVTYRRHLRIVDDRLPKIVLYGESSTGHRDKGHLWKDTKALWKGPSPLVTSITASGQHKQPIAWTGEAQSTRPSLHLKPHEGPTWKRKGQDGNDETLLKSTLYRPWRAAAVERLACLG